VIDHLDELLRQLFSTQVSGLVASQIGFNPPDDDWRNQVQGGNTLMLNVYLIELRENAALRSNERFSQLVGGDDVETRAPARLDCHYLISAWSPVKPTPLVEPAIDEDVLLYGVTRTLMDWIPLDATAIYAPGPVPAGFPDEMLAPPLPAVVAPPETFPKLPDFWMRMDTIWRPVVDLTVTLPVAHAARAAGPPVTTMFGEYGTVEEPALEELVAIGGVVRLSGSNAPVVGAWVRLVEPGQTVTTNIAGQFIFTGIRRGSYTLEAGASGHATQARAIDVPSLSGEYDIFLT
jgi:Pvc16 N-terminal domain/Carboxypeptidase regulatory-like domain